MIHITVTEVPLVGMRLVIVTSTVVNPYRCMCNADWHFRLYHAHEPDKCFLPVPQIMCWIAVTCFRRWMHFHTPEVLCTPSLSEVTSNIKSARYCWHCEAQDNIPQEHAQQAMRAKKMISRSLEVADGAYITIS